MFAFCLEKQIELLLSQSITSFINYFHHVTFYVSNALQSSFWYCCNFGFERFAVRKSKNFSEIAVRNGSIILVFKCALLPDDLQIGKELLIHGDFIKDVSFVVDDIDAVLEAASKYNHQVLRSPKLLKDECGSLRLATIQGSAGGIVHTLVQNIDYTGLFLLALSPLKISGYAAHYRQRRFLKHGLRESYEQMKVYKFLKQPKSITRELRQTICLAELDHVVEGHPEDTLEHVVDWYNRILEMSRFWSIDDKQIHTQYSALRAALVGNAHRNVKMTLVEPVTTKDGKGRRGQVQEFIDYHGGPGIQHIAFKVDDITTVVHKMRERGVEFLDIPESYYNQLELRLADSKIEVLENLQKIRKLKILIDFDNNGYLLQIFTKPMQDRPTLFVEVIQRHNYDGFGAGNFKALFAAVELEQKKREGLYS
uniref:4-hydroxyphenylpyruvate dioxygenase n=1 Tax=Ditylenchus dipsaci TaxID=166011 RepID=A0A915EMP7_9BILA